MTVREGGGTQSKATASYSSCEGEGEASTAGIDEVNQESHSPILVVRWTDRSWSTGAARSGRPVGVGRRVQSQGLPVRSGTSTRGLSTAKAVSGTRGRDGELDKVNRRVVLDDGK